MISISQKNFINTLLFILIVFIYICPSIYNGFPYLFSDSGTYLISGQLGEVPVDRPIIYGLFVRHISLSWSIWLVIIVHSIIINYLILLLIKYFVQPKKLFLTQFFISFILFMFTSIGFNTNLVAADIFTSFSIITFLLLLVTPVKSVHFYICALILGFSLITHLSHVPMIMGLVVIMAIFSFWKKGTPNVMLKKLGLISALTVFSLLVLATINYSFGAGFELSRIKNIVFGARLIEMGAVNNYLKDNCKEVGFSKPYEELCQYVDQFNKWPSSGHYLWIESSPLYNGECNENGDWKQCWLKKEEAYEELVIDVLAVPKYRNDFIAASIAGTFKQLITFSIAPLDKVNFDYIIRNYYEFDTDSHINSIQFDSSLLFEKKSLIDTLIFNTSVLIILYLLFYKRNLISFELKWLVMVILFALLGNAFICSTLSNVVPRYQNRIIFLVPLALLLVLLYILKEKLKTKELNLNKVFIEE